MKLNKFEEYLIDCMGVPIAEAIEIHKESDQNLSGSTNGSIQDYDGQLMHNCIAEAKRRGYVEAGNGNA